MDLFIEALKSQFVWGLLLGLLIAFFIWKSGYAAGRQSAREIKRLEAELKEMQGHLNTQLKINASGNESLQNELEALRRQNENLRVNNAALQQKPGRAEQQQLQVYEIAIRAMRGHLPLSFAAVAASTTKFEVPNGFTAPFSGTWYSKALIGFTPGTSDIR
jgi:hypothetical protein